MQYKRGDWVMVNDHACSPYKVGDVIRVSQSEQTSFITGRDYVLAGGWELCTDEVEPYTWNPQHDIEGEIINKEVFDLIKECGNAA